MAQFTVCAGEVVPEVKIGRVSRFVVGEEVIFTGLEEREAQARTENFGVKICPSEKMIRLIVWDPVTELFYDR